MKKPNIAEGEKIIGDLLAWLQLPVDGHTKDTPKRVAKMYLELFSGLYKNPPKITTFEGKDGYVAVSNINFTSYCAHHLLPFFGKVGVVYHCSNRTIVGLSKIARIIGYHSAKPQVQENLTADIAEDIMKRLQPKGIFVVCSAEHLCMTIRGVKSIGSVTTTSCMLGDIDKAEALNLLQSNKQFFQ
jgi:GTP cyclohydrolase I